MSDRQIAQSAPSGRPRKATRHARPAVLLLLALALAAGGCTAGPLNDTATPVILVVGNINPTSDPFGDIIGTSGTILDDTIDVDLTARTKNPSDITQPALQDIVVERYEVTFERTDGGTAVPKGFQRAVNVRVRVTPHGQQNEFITQLSMVLVPSTQKAQPPISHLISPGVEPGTGFINIQVRATIRFFGTTIAGEAVTAQATMGINFANFGDTNL